MLAGRLAVCGFWDMRPAFWTLFGHSLGTYLNEWSREFEGEAGARYKVSVVDTWDMTEEELPGTFEGKLRIDLPSKQYMLLRLTKVGA